MLVSTLLSTLAGAAVAAAAATTTYAFCGGIANIQCKGYGEKCYDDPRDKCNPARGGADCSGICLVPHDIVTCGGFAGKRCPEGTKCYDFPEDGCDPRKGGADCIGFCI